MLLVAGPSRKRHISTSSDSENEKKEPKRSKMRGQRSLVMKPRRLLKACKTFLPLSSYHLQTLPLGNMKVHLRALFFSPHLSSDSEVCADTTITQVSSEHTSSDRWEAELDGDGDVSEFLETPEITAMGSNLCQQFSSEMKMKFEVRARQTLRNIEQVSTACKHTHTHTHSCCIVWFLCS